MTTDKAIEVTNKIQLSDNPLWLEVKRLACEYEKQIDIDSEHIIALQKTNSSLTDRVNELEVQIEKMKCCGNCKYSNQEGVYTIVCKVGGVDKTDYIEIDDNQVCDKWVLKEIKEND